MVYQQFINYPSMTVYDNIASPLRLRGDRGEIDRQVRAAGRAPAHRVFLERLPAELSGGQQQRVALARPGRAPLMLLDEPLVNLDYKLREELREELCQLFASGEAPWSTTTEPAEALLLGGYTAVLDEGELLQYGPTAEVFHHPRSIRVARASATADEPAAGPGHRGRPAAGRRPAGPGAAPPAAGADGGRARQRAARGPARAMWPAGTVELAEISGSDTFVHVRPPWASWWPSSPGCTSSSWARRHLHQPGAGACLRRPGRAAARPQRGRR
jgi:glycerol transport system ATP-binding protein